MSRSNQQLEVPESRKATRQQSRDGSIRHYQENLGHNNVSIRVTTMEGNGLESLGQSANSMWEILEVEIPLVSIDMATNIS